jgi:WD40 repeat protein
MPIAALPSDALILVLAHLPLVRNIKGTKRTSRAFRDAAPEAEKAFRHRTGVYEHAHAVKCVAAAPGGRLITGSYREVKVWRDDACERAIQAHSDWVSTVVVLPGGARFVSGSFDGTANLWTLDGALVRTFDGDATIGNSVRRGCVAALPDGERFAVGIFDDEESDGCAVRLYHVDGTLLDTIDAEVYAMVATPDGHHIISGERHTDVSVWNVDTNSVVSTFDGHTSRVNSVAVTPNGQRILSGGLDGTVCVWRMNGTLENTFALHTLHVNALVALPDNQHALSASHDNTVKLFNVNNGAVVRTFTHHAWPVNCLALMPDGLRFVSGSEDATARIVEIGSLP